MRKLAPDLLNHVFVNSFYSDRKRGRNDARASDFELRDYCYNSAVQGCVLVLLNTWLQRRDTTYSPPSSSDKEP